MPMRNLAQDKQVQNHAEAAITPPQQRHLYLFARQQVQSTLWPPKTEPDVLGWRTSK